MSSRGPRLNNRQVIDGGWKVMASVTELSGNMSRIIMLGTTMSWSLQGHFRVLLGNLDKPVPDGQTLGFNGTCRKQQSTSLNDESNSLETLL